MYQGLLDGQGRVVYANKTALAGIRADAADVLGKPFWQTPWFTATPDMPQAVQGAFARVLQGEAVRIEMQLLLPAGERMFDFAMRPIFDQYGAITGAVPEAVDITERKQGEEALRQSQKMEAVGQLTGGVAHDFNNLLTIIRSATDFLRRRELPDERRRRYIDAISDTVDRASKLTGQLLAFARRQPLKPQIFNVGNQIESVAQLIRPVVGSGIQITLDVGGPDAGFFALADVAQFETAIINLAVNARDAMPEGGELLIKVAKVDGVPPLRGQPRRAGAFIAVSMTDTGIGIPADKLEMIFEPFFTTKEVGKGTGLGLSQAFGFAKQSGGDITVRSAPAAGATFTLYLPQAEMPQDAAGVEAAAADAVHSGRGHRVLVVEDNEDIGRFSTDLLQDLGYKISWVTNATDALTALSRRRVRVRPRVLRHHHARHERRRARHRDPRALSRAARGVDIGLQQRARRERPLRVRADPEAVFGGSVVAHAAARDRRATAGGGVKIFGICASSPACGGGGAMRSMRGGGMLSFAEEGSRLPAARPLHHPSGVPLPRFAGED